MGGEEEEEGEDGLEGELHGWLIGCLFDGRGGRKRSRVVSSWNTGLMGRRQRVYNERSRGGEYL